ncbi:MAG: CopG family transcriptional regulator [Desulfobacterales bacterium]|nr:CopG family transcriptional regulator [Desulfobacterales bacterium]
MAAKQNVILMLAQLSDKELQKVADYIKLIQKDERSDQQFHKLLNYTEKPDAYSLGKDLFGKYGSGKGKLSQDYKKILKEKLRENRFNK